MREKKYLEPVPLQQNIALQWCFLQVFSLAVTSLVWGSPLPEADPEPAAYASGYGYFPAPSSQYHAQVCMYILCTTIIHIHLVSWVLYSYEEFFQYHNQVLKPIITIPSCLSTHIHICMYMVSEYHIQVHIFSVAVSATARGHELQQ